VAGCRGNKGKVMQQTVFKKGEESLCNFFRFVFNNRKEESFKELESEGHKLNR
jgi:hypothetical protein